MKTLPLHFTCSWPSTLAKQGQKLTQYSVLQDRLLQNAVQLFATGPLDDPKSLIGVWKKAKAYIRENGGTTTAGDVKLKERWHKLNGLPVPSSKRAKRGARARGASATSQARSIIRTEPPVALAPSFPIIAGQNQPTSSAQRELATVMDWEEYEPLSEGEMREALGSNASEQNEDQSEQNDPDMEWEDYPPLSESELRQALGSEYSDYVAEQDKEQQQDPDLEWEEYEPLSEGEMRDALGSDYHGEEEDGDNDSDYEEN